MQLYPKWKYHQSLTPTVVATPQAETELGEGWYDTPGELEAAVRSAAGSVDLATKQASEEEMRDLDVLRATANDMGIVVDGRWKAQRLEEEIKAKIEADENQG